MIQPSAWRNGEFLRNRDQQQVDNNPGVLPISDWVIILSNSNSLDSTNQLVIESQDQTSQKKYLKCTLKVSRDRIKPALSQYAGAVCNLTFTPSSSCPLPNGLDHEAPKTSKNRPSHLVMIWTGWDVSLIERFSGFLSTRTNYDSCQW